MLRSPSPLSSSSQSRSARASSPLCQEQSAFNTRDIQFSLASSTAATMQPDSYLARLSQSTLATPRPASQYSSDPPSGLAAPTIEPPTLRSPVRLDGENPYPSVSKRRAQHQLDDELSPGGSDKRDVIEQLFRGHTEGRHRRVRSRGFSLGDVNGSDRLEKLFQQAVPEQQAYPEQEAPQGPQASSSTLQPPPAGESVRRLGSPFSIDGGRSMPTRRPSRHLASASLSAFDPGNFTSIDQRIRATDLTEEFLKQFRE
ncbi:MAG: hypothetical protein LQ344_002963 [Seirophora lacunosa]|nr:MAG: hypothetical protein LQ344_002963 [Seirophora lacunosa]